MMYCSLIISKRCPSLISRFPDATLYQAIGYYINAAGALIRPCLPMDEKTICARMSGLPDGKYHRQQQAPPILLRSLDYDALGGMPPHFPKSQFCRFLLWIHLMAKGYKATSFRNCFSYRVHNSVSRTTNGMAFLHAFGAYVKELHELQQQLPEVNEAVQRHGKRFLLFWCESLSHRLLKTPLALRSLKVDGLIRLYREYAATLIPGQSFEPASVKRISLAGILDSNARFA